MQGTELCAFTMDKIFVLALAVATAARKNAAKYEIIQVSAKPEDSKSDTARISATPRFNLQSKFVLVISTDTVCRGDVC